MKKYQLYLTAFSLALSMGAVNSYSFPAQVQAQVAPQNQSSSNWKISQAFTPPDGGKQPTTAGGGTRSLCVRSKKPLTALIPDTGWGLTVENRPSIFVYLPQTEAQNAEFVLKDEDENDVYRTILSLPKTAGIFSFKLPADKSLPALEVGKNYHWYWALICNPKDRREDVFVDGWLEKAQRPDLAEEKLKKVAPQQRAGIYAKNGIWYSALSTLAELRQANPQDPAIAANWQALLNSVGLEKMVSEPLVQ